VAKDFCTGTLFERASPTQKQRFAFTRLWITGELKMFWARLLAFMSPEQNQELLLRNEYLAAENRILGGQSAWLYVPRVLVS
jgi:hypothetical protein